MQVAFGLGAFPLWEASYFSLIRLGLALGKGIDELVPKLCVLRLLSALICR